MTIQPRAATGISLAVVCLCILGVMPIIANSRPDDFSALGFAFLLSVWQVVLRYRFFCWNCARTNGVSLARHSMLARNAAHWW